MAVTVGVLVGLVAVSLFWGATNPFMKKGAKGVTEVKSSSRIGQFLNEIGFLVKNTSYLIPFLINQIGSVIFIFVLQNADISLAVPVTNSLTFLFTAITGWFLGEKTALRTYLGMILILAGTTLCCISKMNADLTEEKTE